MSEPKHPDALALQACHDGELDPAAATAIAAHCARCAACRTELEELARVAQLLSASTVPELRRSVFPQVRPGRAREARLRPALGFAACAAGIVLGVLLGPIRFHPEATDSDASWTGSLAVWSGDATSPLLAVYRSGQE